MEKIKLLFLFLIVSCSSNHENQNERQQILAINKEQRTAHMTNDAQMLVRSIADSLISVDSGKITINSLDQVLSRFTSYFRQVKYLEWDDVAEPMVQISSDGSLATMSVMKRTIIMDSEGVKDTTIFAWTSAFKKVDQQWKMYSITSTDDR